MTHCGGLRAGTLRRSTVVGLAVMLFVGFTPTVSSAQGGSVVGTITMWEVQEFLRLKQVDADGDRAGDETGDDAGRIALRLANATLVGAVKGGLCGGPPVCPVDAQAISRVDLQTGNGPFTATLNILFDTDPRSQSLSTLVLVARVAIKGTLDLSPVFRHIPLALVEATWTSEELSTDGTLTGAFLIPIPAPACALKAAYFDPRPQPAYFECLAFSDFSLGKPLTKFTGTFATTTPGHKHEDGR